MIDTVSVYDFRNRFLSSDTYKNNFSYEGLTALFNYLEELEDSMGEQIEFDMVAIACDYSEYESLKDLQNSYPDIKTMEDLEDHTTVIPINNESFIIQDF